MHLKSLTLKGFKSFATSTTLRFEPGITCVVGPNGSGKSNVVDAIAWVLGEQGAKALRGATMSDVIFAGTTGQAGVSGRAPLGRAEVTLTIDNADGALPIDYSEVSVSRLLYRSGDSEYAINGTPCRLLDVQELLSDTGIGRELHVIVGQGQLDAVLHARPEERRGFIEEAAGVLKHRKRKEKALRKLEAMQAGLTRLGDLTGELRRQLTPLGKQAEVARRATSIQAALRDARLRILAEDLTKARVTLDAEVRDEADLRRRQTAAEADLAGARTREADLESAAAQDAPRVSRAQETWYRLSALDERLRGLATLASERARHLGEPIEAGRGGRDPDELEAEAGQLRAQEQTLLATLTADRATLTEVSTRRASLEAALAAEEKATIAAARAAADRREGLARLAGQVGAQRSRAAAAEEEIGRLSVVLEAARERLEISAADLEGAAAELPALDEGEAGLDERHETAGTALAAADERLLDLETEERAAERDRATAAARREALALALRRRDGTGALLAADLPGVLGSVAALLHVSDGHQAAVAAALGVAADAIAVATVSDAVTALEHLSATEGGRAGLVVGDGSDAGAGAARIDTALPAGCRYALDVVEIPGPLTGAVRRLLAGVVVTPDLSLGRELVARHPELRAVTPGGDLIGRDWAVGGSASSPSTLETQAAHDEAAGREDDAVRRAERTRFGLAAARSEHDRCATAVAETLDELHASDAAVAAIQERLALLGGQVRAAGAEADRFERARRAAETARDQALIGLTELEGRLSAAENASDAPDAVAPDQRDSLATACTAVRAEEVEARLAVRTGEERARAMSGRAESLARAAQSERVGRLRLEALRATRTAGATRAAAVAEVAGSATVKIADALIMAAAERDSAQTQRTVREGELLAARASARGSAELVAQLRDVVHRDEVARTEQRLRIEALELRAIEDHGIDVAGLAASYGPDVPVPGETDDDEPQPYDRATQEKRAATADRQLALLGKVNPLALEEFAALEERHAFLSTQLEDLRASRKDLLGIVKDVDERIHEVFASAFADTAREFEIVFATLFPGGEGRLILTDPDDLLISGVEVEARPPGKKVKRLSLLSGGERSLTAVALLLAIFRARPSPFYVMDEVEAALDDINLGRLLEAMEGLRERSQLIVITHQKRTMEIADALYGVTMRGDGVSTVISQRLRERSEEPVGAPA